MKAFSYNVLLLSVLLGALCSTINCYAEDSERNGSFSHAVELLENGVVFEAIHELELYVEDNPNDEDAYMLLARTLQMVKRDRRTAVAAAQVLRINPDNAEARRLLTRIRIKLGRNIDRSDPAALLDYARLCSRPETYDRAADFYNLYLEQDDDPLVHMEFAKVLYWAGNYRDSKRHLLIYIDDKPDDTEMRGLLGNIQSAMGDFDGAVAQYRLCVDGGADDIEMKLNLVRALMWNGQEEEAEKLLTEIRDRSGEYDAPLILLAAIARMQGRVEDEYNLYKSALKVNPENKEAVERVAEFESGDVLEIAKITSRLASNHADIKARRKLVDLYLSKNRYGEAIPHLEVLNSQVPMDLEIAEALSRSRKKEGELAMDAVNAFRQRHDSAWNTEIDRCEIWLRDNPNDYQTRVQLADILVKSRRYESAIGQFEMLASMTPGNSRIAEKLQQVRLLSKAASIKGQSTVKEE